MVNKYINEVCAAKFISKIIIEGIPTEWLVGYDTSTHQTIRSMKAAGYKSIVVVMTKEGLAGPHSPILLLVWQRLRSVETHFCSTCLIPPHQTDMVTLLFFERKWLTTKCIWCQIFIIKSRFMRQSSMIYCRIRYFSNLAFVTAKLCIRIYSP